MEITGNFATQFGRGLPTESYLSAIATLSKKSEDYIYDCYLKLVQNVLKEVVAELNRIAEKGDVEKEVHAICHAAGINLARAMVIDCIILDKLLNLFTTQKFKNENQRLFDSFNNIVVKDARTDIADKKSATSNLIVFFNHAQFKISTLRQKNFIITDSIGAYCLSAITRAIGGTEATAPADALLAIRNLPDEVVYTAFGNHFEAEVTPTHVSSLDRLHKFAAENGQNIYENYWRLPGCNKEIYYVEAVASVNEFINGLADAPYDKMLQIVWYATHIVTEGPDTAVRFLLKAPDTAPVSTEQQEDAKYLDPLAIGTQAAVDMYDKWVKSKSLNNLLVGIDIYLPEDKDADKEKMQDLFNNLHNRIFIKRDALKILRVTMNNTAAPYNDRVEMNRWIQKWADIKEPWDALNENISHEILKNYANVQHLAMKMDTAELCKFCYSGLGRQTGERYPAFSPPLISLRKDHFERVKKHNEKRVHLVVSGYLESIFIFNKTNTKMRLGYLTQVGDDALKMIAGSRHICIDIIPWWSILSAIHCLDITPRQLNIAKAFLLIESKTANHDKTTPYDLDLIEMAVEINTREKGKTGAPGTTLLNHSPVGKILKNTPTQFVLGDGGAGIGDMGIVEEYKIFDKLVSSPSLLTNNVIKYRRFILNNGSHRLKANEVKPEKEPDTATGSAESGNDTRQ